MEVVLALLMGACFLLIWIGLTHPRSGGRVQRVQRSEQYRFKELEGGLSFMSGLVNDLADLLLGEGAEAAGWRRDINERYLQLLKQSDWYWAPGEAARPTPEAPFWNLETMWAAKVSHAILFGLGGAALMAMGVAFYGWGPITLLIGLAVGGLIGFADPDSEVAGAAEQRRRQIILEMGYKVPELRVYVRSGRTFVSALRYLTLRPGGPFVRELYRALQVYDITGDMERGVRAIMERNRRCEPLMNMCGDLLAVLAEGGELGVVLEAHTDTAQHEQRRLLRQQGQDNTQSMSYVVAGSTLIVIFLLIGGPALYTVVTSL